MDTSYPVLAINKIRQEKISLKSTFFFIAFIYKGAYTNTFKEKILHFISDYKPVLQACYICMSVTIYLHVCTDIDSTNDFLYRKIHTKIGLEQ